MLSENDIIAIQNLQKQLQNIIIEKESLKLKLAEIESALEELKNVEKENVYRLYGDVLISKKKEEVEKELKEEKENIEIRIKSLEKVEKRIIESLKEYEKKLGEKK